MTTVSFRKTALAVAIATAGFAFGAAERAQAETFSCPASVNVKTLNTPAGWAATLPTYRFESAKIKPAGNRKEMRCYYSNGIRVAKNVPLNSQCRVQGNGFVCDAIAAAPVAPPVHKRATLRLVTNQTGDLDTGNIGGNGADILLGIRGLEGLGTTRFSEIVGKGDYARCSKAAKRHRVLKKRLLKPNARFCAQLSSGRIASVVVSKKSRNNIEVAFRTWKKQ